MPRCLRAFEQHDDRRHKWIERPCEQITDYLAQATLQTGIPLFAPVRPARSLDLVMGIECAVLFTPLRMFR